MASAVSAARLRCRLAVVGGAGSKMRCDTNKEAKRTGKLRAMVELVGGSDDETRIEHDTVAVAVVKDCHASDGLVAVQPLRSTRAG